MNGGMRVKREGIMRKGTMAVAAITIAAALVMSGCAADADTQNGITTEAAGETQTSTHEGTSSQEAATQDTASQVQTTTQEQRWMYPVSSVVVKAAVSVKVPAGLKSLAAVWFIRMY